MSAIILHHYDISPYAEKIRLVLGLKRLAWSSVINPMVMPKPDLTPLTGGYRRIRASRLMRLSRGSASKPQRNRSDSGRD